MPESVALELERLRGAVDTGFAQVQGSLLVLVERSDRSEEDIKALTGRVASLEKARWPMASLTAVVALGALAITLVQMARGH